MVGTKQTHRTAQKHAKHQDATDNQNKLVQTKATTFAIKAMLPEDLYFVSY